MDKDRIKGKAEEVSGRIKQKAGEWTRDAETEAEGAKERIKGKAHQVAGKVRDKVREAEEKLREREIQRKEERDKAA